MDGLVVDHGEDDALDREEVVQAMVRWVAAVTKMASTYLDCAGLGVCAEVVETAQERYRSGTM